MGSQIIHLVLSHLVCEHTLHRAHSVQVIFMTDCPCNLHETKRSFVFADNEQPQPASDAASPAAETEEPASEPADGGAIIGQAPSQPGKSGSKGAGKGRTAISARGHTNRGRVRQKSHKSAELVEVGKLR